MKGTSHIITGVVTGIQVSHYMPTNPALTIGIVTLGSLIVDIDEKHSMINRILFPGDTRTRNIIKWIIGGILLAVGGSFHSLAFLQYIGAIILLSTVSSAIQVRLNLFKGIEIREYHRTLFHDPLIGSFLLTCPLYFLKIPNNIFVPFIIGIILHYLMDCFTIYGIPLILLNKRLRMPIIHYDSRNLFAEYLIVGLYSIVALSVKYPGLMEMVLNYTKSVN